MLLAPPEMEGEPSMDLDSLGGYPINIYNDPRAAALDPDDSPASTHAAATPAVSTIPIKQEEPQAPPSPLANTTHPFAERSHTPAAVEPTIEAHAPPPSAPPPSPSAAAPPPRRRRSRTTPASTKACTKPAPRVMRKMKKAAKGDEAAVDDKACNLAWAVWLAYKGKDPCSSVEGEPGRKKKFDYYSHFDAKLLYACARYPKTFKQWVLREGFLRANPGASAKGRIPCKATLSRAVKKFKKLGIGAG